ncbi:MAG: UDP-N-acetylmuramate dehydrogenase [Sandaracinus sp.]
MRITFAVDDVTPASGPPPTRRLGELVGPVLALGGDAALRVLDGPRTHPLLGAVHVAFSEHRPLVLGPDALWLTVAQGLARHVRLHSERLRGRLVRHEGTKRLTVHHEGPFPTDPGAIATLLAKMHDALAAEIGPGSARRFSCDFSTTTSVERTASHIVLLDAYSPFFDYEMVGVCGIPSITLTGTLEDWQSILRRVRALDDLVHDSPLADWPSRLVTIVDKLIEAVDGAPDRAFFQRIYKPKSAYGGDKVTGWIGWLYPYLEAAGRYDRVNPLLAHAPDRPLPGEDRARPEGAVGPDWWTGPGLALEDVPATLAESLFHLHDERTGERQCLTMSGGLAAIALNDDGSLEPRAAWWCMPGRASIDELAARLRALGAPPAPDEARPQRFSYGSTVAELAALGRAVAPFSLFEGRVRLLEEPFPLALAPQVRPIAFAEVGHTHLLATYRGWSTERVYCLVPLSALAPAPPSPDGIRVISARDTLLSPADVPVISRSLAQALGAALDAEGLPGLSPIGKLFELLDPDLRIPRLPYVPPRAIVPAANVPLAPRTTLQLGGTARYFVSAQSDLEIAAALAWAESERLPVFVLGGGSNLIVPDEGVPGLVLAIETRGIATMPAVSGRGERTIRVTAAAGEPWDDFVATTVQHGWQGLECLSGIPGLVGSTPVQNVGAYGQDVSETIVAVGVLDRATRLPRTLSPEECQFAYRDSALKREPSRYVVTWVCFELRPGAPPALKYAELQRALSPRESPTLAEVRDTVIALRKKKSMVLDPLDPNRRSAGSFFTNPIVSAALADEVVRRALERGVVQRAAEVPRWPEKDGRVKLAAGWLIEKSGIAKGLRQGQVGVSSAHALALVHHGGGTTRELLALAAHVQDRVRESFGVELEREPVLLGAS